MKALHVLGPAPLYTNTFLLLWENGHAVAVDPAASAEQYLDLLQKNKAELTDILLTHGHYDHVGAVEELKRRTGARIHLSKEDMGGSRLFPLTEADAGYEDGETIAVDDMTFTVIRTPGHTAGSVCLLCGDLLFAGDTLFAGDIGRTDLEGSRPDLMRASLQKLCGAVTSDAQVLPGHDRFSTMDAEKAENPYLRF